MSTEFTADTDFTSLTMPNLKKFLKERNLPQSGNKTSVIIRIKEDLESVGGRTVLAEEAKAKSKSVEAASLAAVASPTKAKPASPVKPATSAPTAGSGAGVVDSPAPAAAVTTTAASEQDVDSPAAVVSKPKPSTVNGDTEITDECLDTLQKSLDVVNARSQPQEFLAAVASEEKGSTTVVIQDMSEADLAKHADEDNKKVDAKVAEKKNKTSGEISDDQVKKNKRHITPIVFDGVSTVTKKKSLQESTNGTPAKKSKDSEEATATDPAVTTQAAENEATSTASASAAKTDDDTPMKDLTQEEKLARRAAKYGIVSTPESKKSARAKRFGASGDTNASPVDIETIKKRAERFGAVTSPSLKKAKEQVALEKRKERFNAMDPAMKEKMEKRAKRFSMDKVEPAEEVKEDAVEEVKDTKEVAEVDVKPVEVEPVA